MLSLRDCSRSTAQRRFAVRYCSKPSLSSYKSLFVFSIRSQLTIAHHTLEQLVKSFKPIPLTRIALLFSISSLSSCENYSPDHKGFSALEQIKQQGYIRVLTRLAPSVYSSSESGFSGFEYDLVTLFAKQLDVKVKFIVPNTFNTILHQISSHQADIAAAGITITQERKKWMRFGPGYQTTQEQVVFRSGTKAPKKIEDLYSGILEVAQGTSYIESLNKLKTKHPDLTWNVNKTLDTDSLMYLVNEGLIDYTIADSHLAYNIKQFYPKLYTSLNIAQSQQLAWALPLSEDDSLFNEVTNFFDKIKSDKTLQHLLDKHFGNNKQLGYVDNCTFRHHVLSRLPKYKSWFIEAGKKNNLDWRLLAAIGYQESHWIPDAESPTGVKGIMMLTKNTAQKLGFNNRIDPEQSIQGGAIYFKQRIKKIPPRIPEPDRTWFALASYNIGYGHLEDARIITQMRNSNPDKWINVKQSLPLLTEKEWYKKTKYGYARGNEPVQYVENIRGYYKLLVWLTEENQIEKRAMQMPNQQLSLQDIKPNVSQ